MTPNCAARLLFVVCALLFVGGASAAEEKLTFHEAPGRVEISVGDHPFATYVYRDDAILRPHYANVHAPTGERISRNQPPSAEAGDSTDHETMHPGLWLAFADVSGADFWRNKAKVEHVEFIEPPVVEGNKGSFVVRNRYVDGDRVPLEEVCRHSFTLLPEGCLFELDSTFTAGKSGAVFGDQEELGFGIRMHEPLKVKNSSGRILSSDGDLNGDAIRGTTAKWCDYSGILDGDRIGILMMPHPENFRPSWYHSRDYGLLVANPFGRKSLTNGEESKVEVAAGKTLRLRFGAFLYAVPEAKDIDRDAIYQQYTGTAVR